jgi:hypothetical protein
MRRSFSFSVSGLYPRNVGVACSGRRRTAIRRRASTPSAYRPQYGKPVMFALLCHLVLVCGRYLPTAMRPRACWVLCRSTSGCIMSPCVDYFICRFRLTISRVFRHTHVALRSVAKMAAKLLAIPQSKRGRSYAFLFDLHGINNARTSDNNSLSSTRV